MESVTTSHRSRFGSMCGLVFDTSPNLPMMEILRHVMSCEDVVLMDPEARKSSCM